MVFRQNLSRTHFFFREDEFYKNLFRELSRRTLPFDDEGIATLHQRPITLNTWDLIHLPDPKVAVCERRAWFRYLSFREAFATLSRISGDI